MMSAADRRFRALRIAACSIAAVLPVAQAAGAEPFIEKVLGPRYPPFALLRGETGVVECTLEVGPSGEVVSVETKSDNAEMAGEARAAALGFRFQRSPATSFVKIDFRFELEPGEAPIALPPAPYGLLRLHVAEAGTRMDVAGATTVAIGFGIGSVTTGKGDVDLRVPAGQLSILVAAPEFRSVQVQVDIPAGGSAEETVYLYRSRPSEFSATVPGERRHDAPTRVQLDREELRNVPGTQDDPLRVISLLPGVARAPFASGQLVVRGARPTDTGAYLNGQRIPILYHLLDGPSVLQDSAVDSIDFLAGGAGVFYGNQIAAIVAVRPRFGDPERMHGVASVDLQKAAAWLEGPVGENTQLAGGGRISYVNPITKATVDPNVPYSAPVFGDYEASVRHRFESGTTATLLAFGSRDSFDQLGRGLGNTVSSQDQRIVFHRLQLQVEKPLAQGLSLSVSPSLGYDNARSQSSDALGVSDSNTRNDETFFAGLRSELAWKRSSAMEMRFGTDFSMQRAGYDVDARFDRTLPSFGVPNGERQVGRGLRFIEDFGTYSQVELTYGPLRVTPGLRLDLMRWSGRVYLTGDPRLWVRYSLTPKLDLFTYAGLYHQTPQAVEIDPRTGNPGLTPSAAQQYGLGTESRFGDDWTLRLEGFYQRRTSLIFTAEPRAVADGTISNPLYLNSGVARSYGLEVLLRRRLSRWVYGWISYTLSKTEELARPGEEWQRGPFDQTHVLSMLIAFRPSTQVEFSTRLRLATGNPQRQVTGAVFDNLVGRYVPITLPLGSARLPGFAQLDFEVNNIWTADVFRLALYVDVENVLGRRNGETVAYDFRYQQQSTFQGIPFSAAVGVRVSF
ncbi:MAG: hypothetical protein ACJ78W_01425 [Myxococcales bacterium]